MIKIVVDSGCDLTDDMKQRNGINMEVAPLTLMLGEKVFIDTEDFDVPKYIEEMRKYPGVPKTAAPSPNHYYESFKGKESVFAVTLSSKLSASYTSAMTAKQMYLEEIGNKFIHVFDSLSASVGEMLIAMKINEFAKNDKTNSEIVDGVTNFINNMKTYFILERYDTAVKTGRMKPYVAKIASLMSFKPICFADEGKMEFLDKARGFPKAINKLIEIIQRDSSDFENRVLAISHVKCYDKALEFKNAIVEKIKFKDVIICEASGLCSTYADEGGIIIAL